MIGCRQRLAILPPEDGVKAALLVIWCLELFLTQLGQLQESEEQLRRKLRKQMMQFLTSHLALVSHGGAETLLTARVSF